MTRSARGGATSAEGDASQARLGDAAARCFQKPRRVLDSSGPPASFGPLGKVSDDAIPTDAVVDATASPSQKGGVDAQPHSMHVEALHLCNDPDIPPLNNHRGRVVEQDT